MEKDCQQTTSRQRRIWHSVSSAEFSVTASEQPAISVQAGTFEQAKSDMEIALGKYIESLLREGRASAEHAA